MQMNYIKVAGSLMKVINILRDDSQLGHIAGKLSDSAMCLIWLGLDDLTAMPFIPSQQSAGSILNASLIASWAGSKRSQRPVSASLNVGLPLSADAPAPVKTTTC